MKQFDLQEFLENPTRPIVTRDGHAARIICVNRFSDDYPIVALIRNKDKEVIECYTKDGKFIKNEIYNHDLLFAPEKKEGWTNICIIAPGDIQLDNIYNSKEEAEVMAKSHDDYVDTIKIEWEE